MKKRHCVIAAMKILTLALLFLLFSNCKKDVSEVNYDIGERRAWFTDTLGIDSVGTNPLFVAYSEYRGTIYVVQKKFGSVYQLTKCDNEINVIYSKTIDLGPNQLIQIVGGKNQDCFYTVTASNAFQVTSVQSIGAYTAFPYIDTVCYKTFPISYYIYEPDFHLTNMVYNTNHTELKKYKSNGEEEWKKTEEGNFFSGSALQVDMDDNIYLLSAKRFPLRFKLNLNYSSAIPYYDVVADSNSFSLSKFSISGKLLFKNEICCVYQENGFLSGFNPSLSLSSSALYVNNINGLYSFNLNLELQSQKKPLKNTCYNFLKSVVTNPNIPFVCVSGYLRYVSNNLNFYQATLVNTDEISVLQNLNFSHDYFAIDKSKNLFSVSLSNRIIKIKSDGTEVFSKILNPDFLWQTLNKNNCFLDRYDNLYCFSLENGLIKVYKLDENGNF